MAEIPDPCSGNVRCYLEMALVQGPDPCTGSYLEMALVQGPALVEGPICRSLVQGPDPCRGSYLQMALVQLFADGRCSGS